jgi:cytochrome b6-f complex iron-sulfur subunit
VPNMITRRQFLDRSLAAACGGCAVAAACVVVPYLLPPKGKAGPPVEAGTLEALEEGQPTSVAFRHSRVFLIRRGDQVVALSAVCSHLGCIVAWSEPRLRFVCPCHAGTFDPEGKPVSGPPDRPLARIPVQVRHGRIYLGG